MDRAIETLRGFKKLLQVQQVVARGAEAGLAIVAALDYVLRDSYMCGVAVGPVDLTRLIHYTIVTDKGFTIHKTGLPALQMFLNTRMYLYSNVYFHRTTRAIDIHLRDIFGETMKWLFPRDPRTRMEEYLGIVPENDALGVLQDTHWAIG